MTEIKDKQLWDVRHNGMGSELSLGLVLTPSLGPEICDADGYCIIFMGLIILHLYSTKQFSKCFHTHCLRCEEPRYICTHMPLLLLSFLAKYKVLLPSAWPLTLGSWPSGSSIMWEVLRNSDSCTTPDPLIRTCILTTFIDGLHAPPPPLLGA